MAPVASGNNYHACLLCLRTFLPQSPQVTGGIKQEFHKKSFRDDSRDEDEREELEETPKPVWRRTEISGGGDLYKKFLLFLGKYLRLQQTSERFLEFLENKEDLNQVPLGGEGEPFCDKCSHSVNDLCELFRKLEVMEMTLRWKLSEMGVVMETGSGSVSKKLEKGLLTRLTKQLNVPTREAVKRFRDVVRVQCKVSGQKSPPKVLLNRDPHPALKTKTKVADKSRSEDITCLPSLKREVNSIGGDEHPPPTEEEEVTVKTEVFEDKEMTVMTPFPEELGGHQDDLDDENDGDDATAADSDWSCGAPSSAQSCVEEEETGPPPRKRKWNLRRRRGAPAVNFKEEDTYNLDKTDNDKEEVAEDKEWMEPPPKRKRQPRSVPITRRRLKITRKKNPNQKYEGIVYCDVCSMSFSHKHTCDKHRNNVHGGCYPCLTCDERFPKNTLLWAHLVVHESDSEKSYACHFCLRGFTNVQLYHLHMKLGHWTKTWYPCVSVTCSHVFDNLPDLTDHLKSCHGNGGDLHFCGTCHHPFLEEAGKELHELVHIKPRGDAFPCPKCSHVSSSKRYLIVHYNRWHGSKLKPVRCAICQWSCFTTQVLKWHYQNRHNDKPEEKEAADRWLEKHSRYHTPYAGGNNLYTLKGKVRKRRLERTLVDPGSPPPPSTVEREDDEYFLKMNGIEGKLKVDIPPCEVENCGRRVHTAYLLRKHLEVEHEWEGMEEKTLSCYHCDKCFKWEQSKRLHLEAVHKNTRRDVKTFRCSVDMCPESFEIVDQLNEHLKSHLLEEATEENEEEEGGDKNEKQLIYCLKCNWGFLQQTALKLHQLLHVSPNATTGQFPCPLCDLESVSPGKLRFHYAAVHLEQPESICEFCGMACPSKYSLYAHLSQVHRMKRGGEKREDVPKVSRPEGSRPKKTKKKPKDRFRCELCGAGFDTKTVMGYHQKQVHGKVLKFACDQCDASFESRAHLRHHAFAHRESQFGCEVCGKMFKREFSLRRHTQTVHNPRREVDEVCNVCGKTFMSSNGMKLHVEAAHTPQSEWRFKCPRCPRRFHRNSLRVLHLKNCGGGGGGEENE